MTYSLSMHRSRVFFVSILLFVTVFSVGHSIAEEKHLDWSRPENIDPLNRKIGDFLDTDLGFYDQKAAVAFSQQRYLDAARYYLFILRHKFDDPATLYNLARCYALLDKPEMTVNSLKRAFDAGYTHMSRLKKDRAFQKVRHKKTFRRMVESLEKRTEALGKTIYVKASKLVKCRVKPPEKFNAEKSYPLLIGLHGNGGSADDFITLSQFFNKQDFIFAAPEGPYPRLPHFLGPRGGQFSWEILVQNEDLWRRGDPLSLEFIISVVEEITKHYAVNQVYLLGFSQGAAYTYMAGIKYPEYFRGIICLSGRFPETGKSYSLITEADIANSNALNVFIAHGTRDTLADYKYAVQAKAKLESSGYNVTYHEFDGGHTITPAVAHEIEQWIRETTQTDSLDLQKPQQEREFFSYDEMRKHLAELYKQKKYKEAELLLVGAMDKFPDKIQANSYNLALMRIHLQKYEEAVSSLQLALTEGQWFGKYAFTDEIWGPLKETDCFKKFEAENQRLWALAQKSAKPELLVVAPEKLIEKKKYPLFIALHGGNSNIAEFKEEWTSKKMKEDFIVAYPQSSQVVSMGGYSWTEDIQLAKQEISNAYHKILGMYSIQEDAVLIGGFSSGGVAALEVALEEIIPTTGFIVLCPAKPEAFTRENIRKAKMRNVRGTILTTEMDPRLAAQKEMAEIVKKEDLSCEFVVTPDIGHWLPKDLDKKIDRAIDYIRNN